MNVFMLTWLRVLALIDAIRNKRWSGNGRPTPVAVAVATALRGGSSRSTPWNRHRPNHHRNRNLRA
jgi:hypothetical protein